MQIGELEKTHGELGDISPYSLEAQCGGDARSKDLSHCRQPKQNIWLSFKPPKKASGSNDYSKNSDGKRKTQRPSTRTIKEQSYSPITPNITHEPNTSTFNIILFASV